MGGTVSHPIESTVKKLKDNLDADINNGIYCTGEMIVPKVYKKLSIDQGIVKESTVVTHGRKIPLKEIINKMNKVHKKFVRPRIYDTLHQSTIDDLLKSYTASTTVAKLRSYKSFHNRS